MTKVVKPTLRNIPVVEFFVIPWTSGLIPVIEVSCNNAVNSSSAV